MVPETDDAKSLALKPSRTNIIAPLLLGLAVLSAVELDNQSRMEAGEIDDVVADRRLSAESIAGELFATQSLPKQPLGVGWLFSQLLRATVCPGGYCARLARHSSIKFSRGTP